MTTQDTAPRAHSVLLIPPTEQADDHYIDIGALYRLIKRGYLLSIAEPKLASKAEALIDWLESIPEEEAEL